MFSQTVVVFLLGLAYTCATETDFYTVPFPSEEGQKYLQYDQPNQKFKTDVYDLFEEKSRFGGRGYGKGVSPEDLFKLFESLVGVLDLLENVEEVQVDKISRLEASANKNLDFTINFRKFLRQRNQDQETQQRSRIKDLREKIKAIAALRGRVRNLDKDANKVRKNVGKFLKEGKQIQHKISDLANANLARQNRIEEAQTRADNLNDRIDALIVKSCANRIEIFKLTTASQPSLDVVTRVEAARETVNLSRSGKNGQTTAVVKFESPLAQTINAFQAGFSAIEINRKQLEYYIDYASIYFSLNIDIANDRIDIQATDMSTGGFSVDGLTLNIDYSYFDVELLPRIDQA